MVAALATADDVAVALGLADGDALSEAQARRVAPLLALVSRRFRGEAERLFTPGTYTHTLRIHRGTVRLMEVPGEVTEVDVPGVSSPAYTVSGRWLAFTDWEALGLNGKDATVTYSWSTDVPDDVVAAVAAIVARALTVDPSSAVAQSNMLQTADYVQQVADWARSGSIDSFSADDRALARSYRYPLPPIIVQQLGPV